MRSAKLYVNVSSMESKQRQVPLKIARAIALRSVFLQKNAPVNQSSVNAFCSSSSR